MKVTVCLIVLSLAIAAVYSEYQDDLEPEEMLTVEDFFEYFELENSNEGLLEVEKRKGGGKVGPCVSPTGMMCQICNLKISDLSDMKRYILCSGHTAPDIVANMKSSKGKGKGKGRGRGRGFRGDRC